MNTLGKALLMKPPPRIDTDQGSEAKSLRYLRVSIMAARSRYQADLSRMNAEIDRDEAVYMAEFCGWCTQMLEELP